MNTQPTALRLADALERMSLSTRWDKEAAAELRRLHQSEREGWRHADELEQERKRLHEVNQELLEALETALQAFREMHQARTHPDWFTKGRGAAVQHEFMWSQRGVEAVSAAIAKAQEQK